MKAYYEDDDNYITFVGMVRRSYERPAGSGDLEVYILCQTTEEHYRDVKTEEYYPDDYTFGVSGEYLICSAICEELITNGFKEDLSYNADDNMTAYDKVSGDPIGEYYLFTASRKSWWAGYWEYPIVSVKSLDGKKTYLDFETGKQLWFEYIEDMR